MAFASNVAPKRVIQAAAKDWKCPTCGKEVAKHWTRCPNDGTSRP
jgi:predicted RNA-binding Zn-ribbon protein involved in translation (DUF1610 family)